MLYHGFYEEELAWIGESVTEGRQALRSRRKGPSRPGRLLAGLYLPSLAPEERDRAVEIAREAGAHGVSFFEMNGLEF